SSAMLAEAIHSVADVSNQALLLLGGRRARRDPTPDHPFGHGRERYFWSFVVALVLFFVGAAFAIYEGIEKVRHPHEIDGAGVAAVILVAGILLESWSLRTAVVEARPYRGNQSWWQFVLRSRNPELPVVLLEDVGAMAGLVLALAAIGLAEVTGEPRWDGVGTISIGLLLGSIAIVLAREMHSLLIGESADEANLVAISSAVSSASGVLELVHLRTQHLGPEQILVGARVIVDPALDTAGVAATIDNVERLVKTAVPSAHPIYVEVASGHDRTS
ncbi:MAG TPA: cation transporter, partial [Acidimicrobiaceae bacterium]|nr:cation transporter [Acidimicrobiaceae bacterium]